MKKFIDDEMQKELNKKLSEKETDIIEVLKGTGAFDWIYSQIETPEDRELADNQIAEMAKQMQPAIDMIYSNLQIPGVAEKFIEQLLPQVKEAKKRQKEDKS